MLKNILIGKYIDKKIVEIYNFLRLRRRMELKSYGRRTKLERRVAVLLTHTKVGAQKVLHT